jgi:hypothetical protein
MVRSVQTNALRIELELTDRHSLLAQVPDIISTAKTSPLQGACLATVLVWNAGTKSQARG